MADVCGTLGFWPTAGGGITLDSPRHYDMRVDTQEYAPEGLEHHEVKIFDARKEQGLRWDSCGFQLLWRPSHVADFYNTKLVMQTYYAECIALAKELTGASYAFTFDHLIREPGRQISGGGKDGSTQITGASAGGGYVGAVHMDYTENTTWDDYLAVHNVSLPESRQVVALNFWRPVGEAVLDDPLAICDASTVKAQDLFETVVYGYGAPSYSWHDLGIETYNVKYSSDHRWYFYSLMDPNEVLVFKSYDSNGVVGRSCPHAAFNFLENGVRNRRSIELRVLCFI